MLENTGKKGYKVCIVKLSAMGDIIHAMVALQFLKKAFPNFEIDWVVEKGFEGILENNPHIDTILPVDLKSIKSHKIALFSQISHLKKYAQKSYDVIIDAQGLLKSAIVCKILAKNKKHSKIIGFDKHSIREGMASFFYDETVAIGYEENVIQRNIKVLCSPFGVEVTQKEIESKDAFLGYTHTQKVQKNNVIFVVGASRINKIYPWEKFLEIAHLLAEEILIVWGNDEESALAESISAQSTFVKTAPKGNLNTLKMQIANARLVIGGDTGPTHMAWALNIPSITIFGNTPAYRNTYLTSINKVITSNSKVNPLKIDKNDFSINEIKVADIVSLARDLLQ